MQGFFFSHGSKGAAGDGLSKKGCPSSAWIACEQQIPSLQRQGNHCDQKDVLSKHHHLAKHGFIAKLLSQTSCLLLYHPCFFICQLEIIAGI